MPINYKIHEIYGKIKKKKLTTSSRVFMVGKILNT